MRQGGAEEHAVGKVAIVTGAAAGIGLAIALRLARGVPPSDEDAYMTG